MFSKASNYVVRSMLKKLMTVSMAIYRHCMYSKISPFLATMILIFSVSCKNTVRCDEG
jgi:hypothetical protein